MLRKIAFLQKMWQEGREGGSRNARKRDKLFESSPYEYLVKQDCLYKNSYVF